MASPMGHQDFVRTTLGSWNSPRSMFLALLHVLQGLSQWCGLEIVRPRRSYTIHWNQKVGWIASGFPQQGFWPPASDYNIFFQLKTIFSHIQSFIWLYLNLFDFIWIYLLWDLPVVTKQYIAIHHVTSKCVLNPFIIEAQHLTTQGNMITADSWAAILPLASAKLL